MWFSKKSNPQYLPPSGRCTSILIIAGAKYNNKGFYADVYIKTSLLLEWLEDYLNSVSGGNEIVKICRNHMLIWLKEADESNKLVTVLDPVQQEIIRPHAMDLVSKGRAYIYCKECSESYTSLVGMSDNLFKKGDERHFVLSYKCPGEHIIYQNEQMIRYIK
jgi:hypothetical protein